MNGTCIAGMHRSGSSAVAGLLRRAGLDLGPVADLMATDDDNSAGYWESVPFVELNDALLAAAGGGWDHPPGVVPQWSEVPGYEQFASRAQELCRDFGARPWGWKDPRNSLTISFWRQVLPDLQVIIGIRNPLEVTTSLQRRNTFSAAHCFSLWTAHYEQLLAVVPVEARIVTSYHALLADPATELERLVQFCGLELDGDQMHRLVSTVDSSRRHHSFDVEDVLALGDQRVTALYLKLHAEAGQPIPEGLDPAEVERRRADVMTRVVSTTYARLGESVGHVEELDAAAEYAALVEQVQDVVDRHTPPGSTIAVVSKGEDGFIQFDGRSGWHFPQTDGGLYAGHHPADGGAAVAHLDDLQRRGAQFLFIPALADWWLSEYDELARHLERTAELSVDHPGVGKLFALGRPRTGVAANGRRLARRRVLYICHSHPSVRPGGAEAYALELYEAMRSSADFEPLLVANTGPPLSNLTPPHPGTIFSPIAGNPNQFFAHTDAVADFDWFLGTSRRKEIYTEHFRDFLLAYEPDVVHFQHTQFLGYDLVRLVHRTLPRTPIVYTLHEFLPICHRDGQMLRATDEQPCARASARRCHECFPAISPQSFFLRQRLIQSHLELVDRFIAPSQFLADKYIEWGLPGTRILVEDYGRPQPAARAVPAEQDSPGKTDKRRVRFGFFGQLTHYKGIAVLLDAMRMLSEEESTGSFPDGRPHLSLHGANLELQPEAFQDWVGTLLTRAGDTVTNAGPYKPGEVAELMRQVDWVVVPSLWWENSPLVIQEAFAAGRPVICSDIGGMAEKVSDGVNGLHFRAGDAASLATVLRRAAATDGLWDELRRHLPSVPALPDHVRTLTSLYEQLLSERRPAAVELVG